MRLVSCFFLALAACTQFPALDGTIAPEQLNGPYPEVAPLTPLIAQARSDGFGAANVDTALSPRLASLRARAAGLRGPVIPPAERARMIAAMR